MTGIQWEYKNHKKSEKFWGLTSTQYKYLGQVFLDFESKYNQSICGRTKEFLLTKEQKRFLFFRVKKGLEKLLIAFNDKLVGLNSMNKTYNGISYKLYYKKSKHHNLIFKLISFHDYLKYSIENNIDLICCGIENQKKNN